MIIKHGDDQQQQQLKPDHHFESHHAHGVQTADVFIGAHQVDVVMGGELMHCDTLEQCKLLMQWYHEIDNTLPRGIKTFAHWPNGLIEQFA